MPESQDDGISLVEQQPQWKCESYQPACNMVESHWLKNNLNGSWNQRSFTGCTSASMEMIGSWNQSRLTG
eukprot:6313310-Lingulodinium_polyedra.AAC.1